MSQLKILGISGSIRDKSSTHVVLHEIQKMMPAEVSFEIFDHIGKLPHFDGAEVLPTPVQEFNEKLRAADGVLICTPEYAFGVPGSLKNALDWTVGTGELDNKPTALITASLSGEKGHEAMLHIFKAINAQVPEGGSLLVSFIRAKVKDGKIVDEKMKEDMLGVCHALVKSIKAKSPAISH
ncbi:MAG: NAD(P)H-dependent oxidoreductase [Bacteroidetes bacterium]|nr:NAD(P)H-dependent oxidoreductase [Bacteroidota bacterium]